MRLILDIGSCHENNLSNIVEIISLCQDVKAELKFQLFDNLPPNFPLNRHLWRNIVSMCQDAGVPVFASVWNLDAIKMLADTGCKTCKFAYSQRSNYRLMDAARQAGLEIIRSVDFMDNSAYSAKRLWCIHEYPVNYLIDFEGRFPKFDGFSDHTVGTQQTLAAVRFGAQIIEKHVTTELNIVPCEDAKFALKPSQVRKLYDSIIRLQREDGQALSAHPATDTGAI